LDVAAGVVVVVLDVELLASRDSAGGFNPGTGLVPGTFGKAAATVVAGTPAFSPLDVAADPEQPLSAAIVSIVESSQIRVIGHLVRAFVGLQAHKP
jgi:hypothetical protein